MAVKILTAPSLATPWPDLDRFEGPGYRQTGGLLLRAVANLYAATEPDPGL